MFTSCFCALFKLYVESKVPSIFRITLSQMMPRILYFSIAALALLSNSASAEYKDAPAVTQLTLEDRLSLARQFVTNISKGLRNAGRTQEEIDADVVNVPDGEELLFRIRLENQIYLDTPILSRVEKGTILVSLRDFFGALKFPIVYDLQNKTASGWYIRENKRFDLNADARTVTTEQGNFTFSDKVLLENEDVMVPVQELSQWFGFALKPDVKALDFRLVSDIKLPIQEQIERKDRNFQDYRIAVPELPLADDKQKMIATPFVDVYTTSEYRKAGSGGKADFSSNASVQSSGDFAKGSLTSQSQWDDQDKLNSLRLTYKKESLEPELLGPLKARRFELGDINRLDIPLVDDFAQGSGVRITNADPQRSYLRPTTQIQGSTFPGWDVELYRGNEFLGFRTVDDSGTYLFEDVDLNTTENRFRVVFYGPQGEIREEEIFIPVDPLRLSDTSSAYDVSVTRQNEQTYRRVDSLDPDDGTININALIEKPIGEVTAVSAGLATRQDNGEQKATVIGGLSTTFLDSFVNVNVATDTNSEMAAELILRRRVDDHEIRNETQWNTEKYGVNEQDELSGFNFFLSDSSNQNEIFSNETTLYGPLGIDFGLKPQYNLTLNYSLDTEDIQKANGSLGFSTYLRPVTFNQQMVYGISSGEQEDTLNSVTSIAGPWGKNRIRLTADYQIEPENKLDRLLGLFQRKINPDLDAIASIQHSLDRKFTEGTAQLTWNAGFAQISPGVTYNSDKDIAATINTTFGLLRDPLSKSIKTFDQAVSTTGGVSAFVFLDKDGDNIFDEDDEVIEGAVINAPQNGGKAITDKDGYAFINGIGALRTTDVFLEENSLPDPYWIPGVKGNSILPREGHVVPFEFPVHIAGEMDGTIYKRSIDGQTRPARSLRLGLYDSNGRNVQSVIAESDGFYVFTKIPPGSYYMNVDDGSLGDSLARPLPQKIQIGYEGTVIYGNNLYLQEGRPDVPLSILATKDIYGTRNEEFKDRNFAINLGTYKSRLSMALAWFKVKTFNSGILDYVDLVSNPSETIPENNSSDKYVLRLSVKENDINQAYKQCARIVKAGNNCALEILPGGLDQTKLAAK